MGLVELGLVVRIIAGTITIIAIVGGVVFMVRKNKYDVDQVAKELTREVAERDKELERVHKRLDTHEAKIHESEKQNVGIMQHLRGLESSISEIKEILVRMTPGG